MNRIKELREEKSLRQSDLAKVVGVNQTCIGKYERGELEPNISTLLLLADFFNVSVDFLLGREDDFGNIVQKSKKESSINKEDREMLDLLKNISPYQREALMVYLKSLTAEDKM